MTTDEHRLHPFSLFHRALRAIPQLLYAFVPILLSTKGRTTAIASLVVTVGFGVFVVPMIVAQYLRFRYRVTDREIVIQSGVFSRQVRNIPIDRVQRVEISQPLLARLFKTARVELMTAGGAGAEGVLEYVSIAEAHRLQGLVRVAQQEPSVTLEGQPHAEPMDAALPAQAPAEALFRLTPALLVRQGMMRFSLVYIALAFSLLQMFNIDLVEVVDFFVEGQYAPYADYLPDSPLWTGVLTLVLALVLSWLAGIATTVNAYAGFTLTRDDAGKLRTARGLLGRFERTIPLRKVQALVLKANAVMRHYGYTRLSAQTMGLDAQARGAAPVMPFAPENAALALARDVFGYHAPAALTPVSPHHLRRLLVRYLVVLAVAAAAPAYWWPDALWLLALAPLLVWTAVAQHRAHGYAFDGSTLVVQRGAFWRTRWAVPLSRVQVFETSATYFQRRLGVVSVYLDTAGASELGGPAIDDLDAVTGAALFDALRARFRLQPRHRLRPFAVADEAEVEHHGHGFAERGLLDVEGRPPDRERPRGGADEAQPPRETGRDEAEEPLRHPLADELGDGAEDDVLEQPLDDERVERLDEQRKSKDAR